MTVELNDKLIERLEAFKAESQDSRTVTNIIAEMIDICIGCYPFNLPGDICVHNDDCMHHKSIYQWKEEQK
jgi:hypothetical protein